MAALLAGLAACVGGGHAADDGVADTAGAASSPSITEQSGGDVAPDSAAPKGKWLDDGNVLALLGTMDARQVDAANLELQSWHSDTVRAFAAAMLAEHDALQHRADSLAAVLRVAPVPPALAGSISARMQARVDSMRGVYGAAFDRAFVAEQIATDQLMISYLNGLAGIAERPEVQALIADALTQTVSELDRARSLEATLAAADSAKSDSLARRARTRTPR